MLLRAELVRRERADRGGGRRRCRRRGASWRQGARPSATTRRWSSGWRSSGASSRCGSRRSSARWPRCASGWAPRRGCLRERLEAERGARLAAEAALGAERTARIAADAAVEGARGAGAALRTGAAADLAGERDAAVRAVAQERARVGELEQALAARVEVEAQLRRALDAVNGELSAVRAGDGERAAKLAARVESVVALATGLRDGVRRELGAEQDALTASLAAMQERVAELQAGVAEATTLREELETERAARWVAEAELDAERRRGDEDRAARAFAEQRLADVEAELRGAARADASPRRPGPHGARLPACGARASPDAGGGGATSAAPADSLLGPRPRRRRRAPPRDRRGDRGRRAPRPDAASPRPSPRSTRSRRLRRRPSHPLRPRLRWRGSRFSPLASLADDRAGSRADRAPAARPRASRSRNPGPWLRDALQGLAVDEPDIAELLVVSLLLRAGRARQGPADLRARGPGRDDASRRRRPRPRARRAARRTAPAAVRVDRAAGRARPAGRRRRRRRRPAPAGRRASTAAASCARCSRRAARRWASPSWPRPASRRRRACCSPSWRRAVDPALDHGRPLTVDVASEGSDRWRVVASERRPAGDPPGRTMAPMAPRRRPPSCTPPRTASPPSSRATAAPGDAHRRGRRPRRPHAALLARPRPAPPALIAAAQHRIPHLAGSLREPPSTPSRRPVRHLSSTSAREPVSRRPSARPLRVLAAGRRVQDRGARQARRRVRPARARA